MIGAYFPCYNRLDAANEVLDSYRRHYPDTTVVMVNDRGDDRHRILAEKYKCQYYYQTVNVGYPGGQPMYYQITEWIHRFLTYICYIKEDWFFLLEDDVFTISPTDDTKLAHDINGINPRNILPGPSGAFLRDRLKETTPYYIYGAMGGAIFRTSFFKKLAENPGDVTAVVHKFGAACPPNLTGQNWYYSDVILSYLAYWYKGTLGQYPEFAELWFSDLRTRLIQKRVGTLNQYKFLYGLDPHPTLTSLEETKYTIVVPLTGIGAGYHFFLTYALPRYLELLDKESLQEFILIVPAQHLRKCQEELVDVNLPITWYTDEDLVKDLRGSRQHVLKLVVAEKVRTSMYLIVDDDFVLVDKLSYADLLAPKIKYSAESYSDHRLAWDNAAHLIVPPTWTIPLAEDSQLMSPGPQLLYTRMAYQLTQTLSKSGPWMEKMIESRIPAICVYWLYLRSTFRAEYYTADNTLFAFDPAVNILVPGLNPLQVQSKIQDACTLKKHKFMLIQSWCKYPLEVLHADTPTTNDPSPQMTQAVSKRLMIYPNTAHLIHTFPAGTKTISLPREVDLSTLLIYTKSGRVVPFRYYDEVTEFEGYGDRHTGDRYTVAVQKDGEIIQGEILNLTPTSATVLCTDGIVLIPNYHSAKVKRPVCCLSPYLTLPCPPDSSFTVSARMNKITWTCSGRGLLDAGTGSQTLYLQLGGLVHNRSERDIHAQVTLVAGTPASGSTPRALMLESTPTSASNEEYQTFALGERCLGAQEMLELENVHLTTEKICVHYTGGSNVQFGVHVQTPVQLPAHALDLYQLTSTRELDRYLGNAFVSAHGAGDEFDILLGESTSVTGLSTFTTFTDIEGKVTDVVTLKLTNHTNTEVVVALRHILGSKPLLDIIPSQETTRVENYVTWTVMIAPGKQEFSWTLLSQDTPPRA